MTFFSSPWFIMKLGRFCIHFILCLGETAIIAHNNVEEKKQKKKSIKKTKEDDIIEELLDLKKGRRKKAEIKY